MKTNTIETAKSHNWKQALLIGVVGVVFCVVMYYLTIFMSSLAFYGLHATDREVEQYVRDSKTMVLTDVSIEDRGNKVYWSIPRRMGNEMTKSKKFLLLQDHATGKYYSLESYNRTVIPNVELQDLNHLYLEINQEELNDAAKGTKENPILVLRWYEGMQNPASNMRRVYMSEGQYRYSVGEYLSTREKWWQVWRYFDRNSKIAICMLVVGVGIFYNRKTSGRMQ